MVLSIWDTIKDWVLEAEKYIERNADEPFLWLGIFGVLLAVCFLAISNLSNK